MFTGVWIYFPLLMNCLCIYFHHPTFTSHFGLSEKWCSVILTICDVDYEYVTIREVIKSLCQFQRDT